MKPQQARPYLIFVVILLVGIAARVWQFGKIPPGINPDEASIGIESYYLLKYGVDRNAMSYPVHLISWGSGQNALYAYLLLPVLIVNGLNAESIRLPMLLAGIFSMPLMYLVGKKMLGEKFGLLAMFFMAVSPWHVISSRWAVESNMFPFVFLAGFVFLLFAKAENNFFIVACALFSISLYAYGTSYAAVPIFLAISVPLLIYKKRITAKQAVIGLAVLALLALPIFIFVVINTLHLETVHLGLVTIPRLPVEARYESLGVIFNKSPLRRFLENAQIMFDLFWTQKDLFAWNHVESFGYFYKITFPFILIGLIVSFFLMKMDDERAVNLQVLFVWLLASICIGLINPVNLTRINLIFTPFLIYIAIFLFELNKRIPYSMAAGVLALLAGFALFNHAYYGIEHQRRLRVAFNTGIIPALEYATQNSSGAPICITESMPPAYIYVLYTQKPNPFEYIGNNVEWLYPQDYPQNPARFPRVLGQYHFQLADCAMNPKSIYVLLLGETPPVSENYRIKKFDKYQVYLPKE